MILIAVAMVAFNQEWHVEEERPIGGVEPIDDDSEDYPDRGTDRPGPAAA